MNIVVIDDEKIIANAFFKLISTNFKDESVNVFYKPNEVTGDIFDNAINNIKEDRTGEDLLFQVLLDMGIPLSSKIEKALLFFL